MSYCEFSYILLKWIFLSKYKALSTHISHLSIILPFTSWISFITLSAFLVFLYLLYQCLRFLKCWSCLVQLFLVLIYYFAPGKDLKKNYGDWALVTGATDGIGFGIVISFIRQIGYVKRLAARGINVVLVSRSQDRLDASAKEVMDKYHVHSVIFTVSNRSKHVQLHLI